MSYSIKLIYIVFQSFNLSYQGVMKVKLSRRLMDTTRVPRLCPQIKHGGTSTDRSNHLLQKTLPPSKFLTSSFSLSHPDHGSVVRRRMAAPRWDLTPLSSVRAGPATPDRSELRNPPTDPNASTLPTERASQTELSRQRFSY